MILRSAAIKYLKIQLSGSGDSSGEKYFPSALEIKTGKYKFILENLISRG
jgi:hypothetical protein